MYIPFTPVSPLMKVDDTNDLRQAFGQFATGVTIVTAAGPKREPIGVTANSFSSVSLQPPMVMWSLAQSSLSRAAFDSAERFCVHVLTASQRRLSNLFATRGENKFGGVKWSWAPQSVPILEEYSARFLCRTDKQFAVGDHVVYVGEVLEFDTTDKRPLVFHGGEYALADRRVKRGDVRGRARNVIKLSDRGKRS